MTVPGADRWARLKDLFAEAVALPADERQAFVDRACGADADLRAELRSLLAADHDDGFLAPPVPADLQQLGPFTLRRVLGAGGMGTVYEATQEAPHRTVALKVLRPFGATPGAARRFELEAEILARLQHPGIAQVYAAGTAQLHGVPVPWFAMELVPGAQSLLQHAVAARLDRPARLRLFLAVCAAVQHGHHKGVVHRDLKPGNVLVGADGAVKVIDFGVARAVGLDDDRSSLRTSQGELLGTLAYMSPEQCAGVPAAVDTRSDVHALGVLLYELLTGRLPFPVQGLDLLPALRVVAEAAPMPAPELPVDLQAVLGKALEKRPDERYASVAAFAADVQCVLDDRPTTARPAGPARQLRLYARRHRGRVAAAVALLLVLVAATVVSAAFAIEAGRRAEETRLALQVAAGERDAAEQNLELLLRSLRAANPLRERKDVSMAELLDRVAGELAVGPGGDPYVTARLHHALAAAYRGVGRSADVVRHGEAALAALAEAPGHDSTRIDVLLLLGAAQGEAGALAPARERLQAALAMLPAEAVPPDPRRVQALAGLGGLCLQAQDLARAATLLEQAVAIDGGDRQVRAEAQANLGTLRWQRGDQAGAARAWEAALALFERELWPDHPVVAQTRSNYGLWLQAQGRHAEAVTMFLAARDLFARLRGADSPDVANAELKLGFLHVDQGDAAAARAAFGRALAIRRARFGDDSQQVPTVLQALGYLELQQQQWAAALAVLDEALQLRGRTLPSEHRDVLDCQLLRGRALLELDRGQEAAPLLTAVVAQRRRDFGAKHPRTAMAESALGHCLLRTGDPAAARPLLEAALPCIEQALGAAHPEARAARARLLELAERTGDTEAAARLRRDG